MGLLRKDHAKFAFRINGQDRTVPEQHAGLLTGAMQSSGYSNVVNKGQDDEMEICCYKTNPWKTALTYLFLILTGGALRLIFHWVPRWHVYATSSKCGINEAQQILVKEVFQGKHKIYYVKRLRTLTPENIQQMKDEDDTLNSHYMNATIKEDLPTLSVHFDNGEFKEFDKLLMFDCKKVTYIWNPDAREFVKLKGLDQGTTTDVLHYNKGLTSMEQFTRRLVYGPNQITVNEKSIVSLLFLEVLNPFYIFQILSFILWFMDNYYYYAAAIIIISMFGIVMSVRQTRDNQRKLKATVHSSDVCTIMRKVPKDLEASGESRFRIETISTELLVPGDIMVIPAHGCIMRCDAVLLNGNCIMNEALLTGESVPVTKTALPNLASVIYDPKEHGRHTLFCGTQVIQTRYIGNENVLAVVVRTGFSTAKGSLVRSILYPPPVDFRFEKQSYKFIMCLASLAGVGFVYTVIMKVMRNVPFRDLFIEACDLITIVVPPALPAAMTVGCFYAQSRLKVKGIFCISPRSINVSGSVDCVCFDKTGTLTEDGLDLLCVVPIRDSCFHMPVKKIDSLPYDTLVFGLVSCHSLTMIDNKIMGDPLDLKMFESTKWIMEEHEVADSNKFHMIYPTVLKPPKNRQLESQKLEEKLEIGIMREFPFSSSSQRMGVIVRKLNGQHYEYYSKGSPEMILNFVRPESVPPDFHDVLESYTQEGYRVIALAHKELKMSFAKVSKVQRQDIEHDMTLLGLIVLENRLKPDTHPCIQALNDANIRVVMATGDNILTAVSVARDCDIITPGQSVITVNVDTSDEENMELPEEHRVPRLYYTLTNTKNTNKNLAPNNNDASILSNSASIVSMDTLESQIQTVTTNDSLAIKKLPPPNNLFNNNYRFAMTGKAWGVVKDYYPELVPRLVTRGSVFARMSPEQKQQLVQELQQLGYCVAMCGDGANDCGALKAAHTGISLSEAESSVASPFTSKNPNITCVLDVIREGRAALVTSFGIFKYMASYSLIQFVSVVILYHFDSNLTDWEFLYIDLFIISIFAFFFGRTESYPGKLVKETPMSSLISFSPLLSLGLQMLVNIVLQTGSLYHLRSEDWFVPFNSTSQVNKDNVGCYENFTVFTVSGFQYIILAVAFSRGKPYRKSLFSNYGLLISAVCMSAFSVFLALWPTEFIQEQFELVIPPSFQFRLYLLAYAAVNFLISMFIEHVIIDYLAFKKLRFKFHNIDKSKRKFMAVERDLSLDTKWPTLTSDFKSAASPAIPEPKCAAQIVIEQENKFDKNHVLNKLYDENGRSAAPAVVDDSTQTTNDYSPPIVLPPPPPSVPNSPTKMALSDELAFSSLPSLNGIMSSPSQSSTYKSFPSNQSTSYDLASGSEANITELPYDTVAIAMPPGNLSFDATDDVTMLCQMSPETDASPNGIDLPFDEDTNNSDFGCPETPSSPQNLNKALPPVPPATFMVDSDFVSDSGRRISDSGDFGANSLPVGIPVDGSPANSASSEYSSQILSSFNSFGTSPRNTKSGGSKIQASLELNYLDNNR